MNSFGNRLNVYFVLQNLIKYIIQQNRDEMLQDLYEITGNNNSLKIKALSFCVNFFLNKGYVENISFKIRTAQ